MIQADNKNYTLRRGEPSPLGATLVDDGINFAVYSQNAENIYLCLFDDNDHESRIEMLEKTTNVWHVFVEGLKAGQRYGFRAHGVFEPENGHRFNVHKLLVDPYAKALSGPIKWDDSVFGYNVADPQDGVSFNEKDSAPAVPKALVVDDAFDWQGVENPRYPFSETIIYETHVKGYTKLHSKVEEELRGTYLGFCRPAVIEHLKSLGVTSIELLPIHQFVNEAHLQDNGLNNYWGYNTLSYFAPDWRYSSQRGAGEQVREFKTMVRELHKAGLEVILDVVYNHTCEGNHLGPTFSLRGLDNANYYRLTEENKSYYQDYTGCGNSLKVTNPHVLRLIMDSLRYWVTEMHVDGFRFDLASTLARGDHEVDKSHSFFNILQQDPVLSRVKLIAEPWDLGEGGYQVGNFPDYWSEWNDKYRDSIRKFWKGDGGLIGELGYRLMGSNDIYGGGGRPPTASVNFITAHDGFTLRDLVSYNQKHNEENKEENRDGNDTNHSFNWGVEGPTDDPGINEIRKRIQKNMLATLLLSQGVPMILAGDEMSRTQNGNNNTYCQDNELNWIRWDEMDQELFRFTKNLIHLRKGHQIFHRRDFFKGERLRPGGKKDVVWFNTDGSEMQDEEWDQHFVKSIGVELVGDSLHEGYHTHEKVRDDNFIWIINASSNAVIYTFPPSSKNEKWARIFDTATDWPKTPEPTSLLEGYKLAEHSMALFIRQEERS